MPLPRHDGSRPGGTARRWIALLRDRLRPPRRLRVTREGKVFVALTLAVGAAAMNTGNNLLYLALSMNLSLVVLSGFLSEAALRRVRCEVRRPGDLFAGLPGLVAVRLSCRGKEGASRSLTVLLRGAGGEAAVPFPDIPPGGEAVRLASVTPRRRGPLPVSASLATSYPFGLFEKSLDLPAPPPLLAWPFPAPPGEREPGEPEREGESRPGARGAQGAAVSGVRGHLPGDALRDVHWKASARLGRLVVKERERGRRREATIRVETGGGAARFEEEISRGCGSVVACAREGRPFRLLAGSHAVADDGGGGSRDEALALLALLRPDGTLPGEGP